MMLEKLVATAGIATVAGTLAQHAARRHPHAVHLALQVAAIAATLLALSSLGMRG